MSPVHVIAEAGTNHNASPETAKKLIDVARECGADSVKFQIIYPEGLYVSKIFQDGVYRDNEVIAIRRAGMLQDDDYRDLARYSSSQGLPLSASVFCQQGLDLLNEFDPPYIKIASCDLNNSILLRQAAQLGKKLIVSTGMATLSEVESAVRDLTFCGFEDFVLMHCVSVYPCPTEQMNLRFLETLKTAFGFPVGLSDHTENSLAASVAVSMGVEWIEKHYTLDRSSEGFDHAYAMEPEMMKQYIADIRSVERACQPPLVKVGETESGVKLRARRGLYANRDIAEGEVISETDVVALRPEADFTPQQADLVIGQVATREIRQLEAFSRSALQEPGLQISQARTA
ncbi:MAG: N-acetylneuraminate synthase family protein [Planctomycetota bacterium]|nr:N-acetylneuraminate synthase family protein [Planctomycetota bacterium]